MPDHDIRLLQRAHTNYVRKTRDMTLAGLYEPHSTGIVTTAGGRYLQVLLVSLHTLRKTGSNLPVEVFLATDEEYDQHFCEDLLPSLNARCRVISHPFGTKLVTELESYQLKVFAILASSFENVLFLDADNLPLVKPEQIFESQTYKRDGMVSSLETYLCTKLKLLFLRLFGRTSSPHRNPRYYQPFKAVK